MRDFGDNVRLLTSSERSSLWHTLIGYGKEELSTIKGHVEYLLDLKPSLAKLDNITLITQENQS